MVLNVEKHKAFFSSRLFEAFPCLHRGSFEIPDERRVKPAKGLFEVMGETLKVSIYLQGHVAYFNCAFHSAPLVTIRYQLCYAASFQLQAARTAGNVRSRLRCRTGATRRQERPCGFLILRDGGPGRPRFSTRRSRHHAVPQRREQSAAMRRQRSRSTIRRRRTEPDGSPR